jgi:hypothetical protein
VALKENALFLTKDVLLLHDTAQPHNANTTLQPLQCFHWEILEYLAYNPNMVACNYHIYPALKDHLGIHTFQNEDNCDVVVPNAGHTHI